MDCEQCASKQANQVRAVTGSDPDVLLVHLNRFNNHGRKLGHAVEFLPYLDGKSDDRRYVLTGVVLHKGESVQRGHYHSVIQCAQSGRLYLLNDDRAPMQIADSPATLAVMYRQAFIFVFSKEDKTNTLVAGIADLVVSVPEPVVPSPVEEGEEGGEEVVAAAPSRKETKRKSRDSSIGTPTVPRKHPARDRRHQVTFTTYCNLKSYNPFVLISVFQK